MMAFWKTGEHSSVFLLLVIALCFFRGLTAWLTYNSFSTDDS